MLPNSITQAIKKKAEDKYHFDKSDYLTDDEADVKIKEQEAYTSGYSDAIETFQKFLQWTRKNEYYLMDNNEWDDVNKHQYVTTEQLLTKYFETKQ